MNFLLSKRMKYFIVTMEEKCITRAAEILCITRSPLGKVISDLEERVGGKLFLRKYNTLEPTPLAHSLYNRIKPLYETLVSIELALDKSKKHIILNLIFDISIPHGLYMHYINIIESENIEFTHKRINVTAELILNLQYSQGSIVLSQRNFSYVDGITRVLLSEDRLCLLVNEQMQNEDLLDADYMKEHPILIRTCESMNYTKNWLSFLLKDNLPYLYFKDSPSDMSTMLYSVSHGKSMVLLPEKMANFYQVKGVRSIIMKSINIKKTMFYNSKEKNSIPLEKITKIYNDYF